MELTHFVVQYQWPESWASLHWNWRETILTESTEAACVDSAGRGWRFVGFSHCYPFLTYSHFIHVKQNDIYHCSVLVAFSDFASERKIPNGWHSNPFECSFHIVENNCDCEMPRCSYSPCWRGWLLPSIYNWALHCTILLWPLLVTASSCLWAGLNSSHHTSKCTTHHLRSCREGDWIRAASSYSYTKPRPRLTGGWTQLVATLGRTAPTLHISSRLRPSQAGRGGAEDAGTLTHTPLRPDMAAMFNEVESTTRLLSLSHFTLLLEDVFCKHRFHGLI